MDYLNFEERAFVDFLIGVYAQEVYGHSKSSFSSLLIDNDYYVIGGSSSKNNDQFNNQSILNFNFDSYEWKNLGDINLDFFNNPLIIPAETCFYVFDFLILLKI